MYKKYQKILSIFNMVKDYLFSWTNMTLEGIETTVLALVNLEIVNPTSQELNPVPSDRDLAPSPVKNYPDLVPRMEGKFRDDDKNFEESSVEDITELNGLTELNGGPMSETFFLLAILFGTCILLYFFPPRP